MSTESTTYTVAAACFSEFVKRFAKLVKLAEKLDCEAPDFEIVRDFTAPRAPQTDEDARRITLRDPTYPVEVFHEISIRGTAPRVPGFRFVGKLEPSSLAGTNFVWGIPGGPALPSRYASAPMGCEHCQTNRGRKSVYLVEDEASKTIFQVGSSCLRDFTGHATPESCARFFDAVWAVCDEDWTSGGYAEPSWGMVGFLAMTAAVVDELGWSPSDSGYPTKMAVVDALGRCGAFSGDSGMRVPTITDAHVERAVAALGWARSLSPDPVVNRNDYLRNLRLAVETETLTAKRAGLVVSIFRAHAGALVQVERARVAAVVLSIPQTDGRVRIEGKIVGTKWKETDYGDTLKIIVQHADGWKLYGSAPKALGRDESAMVGLKVSFDARVEVSQDDPKFGFFSRPTKVVKMA